MDRLGPLPIQQEDVSRHLGHQKVSDVDDLEGEGGDHVVLEGAQTRPNLAS